MGKHTTDDVLEHLRGRSAVERTSGRLGQVTLSEIFKDLNSFINYADRIILLNLDIPE